VESPTAIPLLPRALYLPQTSFKYQAMQSLKAEKRSLKQLMM
jgi:hypothetical protein